MNNEKLQKSSGIVGNIRAKLGPEGQAMIEQLLAGGQGGAPAVQPQAAMPPGPAPAPATGAPAPAQPPVPPPAAAPVAQPPQAVPPPTNQELLKAAARLFHN